MSPTNQEIVMMAGAILGQPEGTADNRHPLWLDAVAQATRAYAALAALRSIPDAKPVAWAIFTDAGNARMWTTFQPHVQKLADAEGLTVTPLYTEPAALAALRSMPEPVEAAAWMRHDDPRQVISAMEKSDAVAAGGAFAASVARYDIPLVHQHEATPHTAPLSDETIQLANVALHEMPRNAGMDALVKQVHSSEAFSFETAAANVERAVLRGGEQ